MSHRFEDEFYRHSADVKDRSTQPAVQPELTCATLLEIVRAGDPEIRRELARVLFT